MLSAGELAQMRAAVETTLPDQCAVLRRTDAPDGAGGWVPTFATVATLPCRVRPTVQNSPNEQSVAARLQGRMPFTVTLPVLDDDGAPVDVREADQVVRAGDPTALEVIGVGVPESWPLSTRVFAARVS